MVEHDVAICAALHMLRMLQRSNSNWPTRERESQIAQPQQLTQNLFNYVANKQLVNMADNAFASTQG